MTKSGKPALQKIRDRQAEKFGYGNEYHEKLFKDGFDTATDVIDEINRKRPPQIIGITLDTFEDRRELYLKLGPLKFKLWTWQLSPKP